MAYCFALKVGVKWELICNIWYIYRMMFEILSRSILFQGLDPQMIRERLTAVHYQVRNYADNAIIASRNDECRDLMIVVKGVVRGEMIDQSGRVLKVEDIHAPRPLAPAFLFGRNNRFPVDVISNQETTLLILPKSSFIRLMQVEPVVLNNYLDSISNRAQFLSSRLYFISFKTLRQKLAPYILQSLEGDEKRVRLEKTQEELAEFFAVSRPSLARVLKGLRDEGIIAGIGRNIEILNKTGLESILRE